jgi:tetratricopeptide (TPR) repeat protein
MAKDIQLNSVEKEKCLLGAISDFTKALLIKPSDFKIYQNRGIAYRDYGTFKLQANTKAYDKGRGISALKASIADLEKALNEDPSRADLESLLELSKEKLATAQGHH